jgi:hypothetical protein
MHSQIELGMKMGRALLVGLTFCMLAVMLGCRTTSSEWNGSWKLDPARSSFEGPTFAITVSTGGEYRYDDGNSVFMFRCDGADHQIAGTDARSCVKDSQGTLELTRKENGIEKSSSHWELSPDGKVFTSTVTIFGHDGPERTIRTVSNRVSGSNDFAGRWQDVSYLKHHAHMTLVLDRQTLHLAYPEAGQYIDAPLSGADISVNGPNAPKNTTYSVKKNGDRAFLYLTKHIGKPLTQGSLELSSDGKTVIESWWNPYRPSDKGTLVYNKE